MEQRELPSIAAWVDIAQGKAYFAKGIKELPRNETSSKNGAQGEGIIRFYKSLLALTKDTLS